LIETQKRLSRTTLENTQVSNMMCFVTKREVKVSICRIGIAVVVILMIIMISLSAYIIAKNYT